MTKSVLNNIFEVKVVLLAVIKGVLIDPAIDSLRVDLESPYQSGEHLNAPRVSENILYIGNIHAKLVCEAPFHLERYLSEDAIHGRNPFVRHGDLRQIWVLEVSIVWLFLLLPYCLGNLLFWFESTSLGLWLFTILKKIYMSLKFVSDCKLHMLW